MHRTEGANNLAGMFTDGPPGTTVEEDWLNAIQEEIIAVLTAAGISPLTAITDTRVQLLAALQTLFVEPDEGIGKNAIINGAMRIAQRGASGTAAFTAATTPANSDDTYLLDRWLLLSDGNDIVDVTQSTEAPTGGLLSCALDVETINKKFGILQVIEQKNCAHMIGGNASLSFYAKVSDVSKLDNIKAMVVSWDGAADTVTSDIVSAWNVEDTTPTLVANWTAENVPANLGITAAWAKYTIPNIAIDTASTKNIGVFIWSDGFCDTVAKFLYITNVQLEKNAVASEYEWRNIQTELALCERYYCKSYDQITIPGAITDTGIVWIDSDGHSNVDHTVTTTIKFLVSMRTTPTITLYDAVGASGKVTMIAGDGIVGAVNFQGAMGFSVGGTNGAASTIRRLKAHYVSEIEL